VEGYIDLCTSSKEKIRIKENTTHLKRRSYNNHGKKHEFTVLSEKLAEKIIFDVNKNQYTKYAIQDTVVISYYKNIDESILLKDKEVLFPSVFKNTIKRTNTFFKK
jgi:hypothetical protein